MLIRIISNVQSFALGIVEPFIKLLHEDNNNDDEGKYNDNVLSALSFSSYPSCDLGRNSPTTNTLGVAKSSFSFRPFVMRAISGCIKALPLPVKSFVVTSIGQLKPLVENVASSGILDGIVKDDTLRLTLPTETRLVTTSSELVVVSSTGLATINDQHTLIEIDDEESYFPNALNFVLTGCLIILLAFGCGIIRLGTAIVCLAIFQVVILEYNYQMISSFINVMMKCLVMIFGASSSNIDSDDEDKVVSAPILRYSSLCLDMSSPTASNELVASDVSIDMPYKPCLVSFLLLIFTSLVEIVDILSVLPCLISFLQMVLTSLVDIVDTLSVIDWLILLTGSIIIMNTTTMTIITTSVSSALDDIDDTSLASRSADDTQSQSDVVQHPSAAPFNLMGSLLVCLSSGLKHVQHERHNLLVTFLLMACAPIPVTIAILMVLLDFWTVLQALVVASCLFHFTTYITKALQSAPTYLRDSSKALVGRVYQFNPTTTLCNIIIDESCLLTLLLILIVPLMGIVVIMMMLILASFNWSVVIQVLMECTMIIPSCLPSVRQACGVAMFMMCLKTITYYFLRMWQYQLSIAFTFLDVIGASSPLVNITSRLFIVISLALKYYDDNGGGVHTTRGCMLSATVHTLNSTWMILAWVVKKFVYLIAYTSILLVYVFIMLVQSIDYKAVLYTSVAYLIQLPFNIVWRSLSRLAVALLGCIIYLYTGIKLFILNISNRVKQKEEPLPPPPATAVSDDEDSDDDDSTIDFGSADPIDCVDQDIPLPPPTPPKRRTRRPRKEYPPAVWHRGRGGRGGRLRSRPPKPG